MRWTLRTWAARSATWLQLQRRHLYACSVLQYSIGSEGVRRLAEAIKDNKTIRSLIFDSNELDDVQACLQTLAQGIEWNSTLEKLVVADNGIDDENISRLCLAFKSSESLKHCNLSRNLIGWWLAKELTVRPIIYNPHRRNKRLRGAGAGSCL